MCQAPFSVLDACSLVYFLLSPATRVSTILTPSPADEETSSERSVTCPASHSKCVAELGLELHRLRLPTAAPCWAPRRGCGLPCVEAPQAAPGGRSQRLPSRFLSQAAHTQVPTSTSHARVPMDRGVWRAAVYMVAKSQT